MQALILAGGVGTRLRPYTTVIPKPLMPVGDMPILEIVLRQLKSAGCNRIILAIGYLGAIIRSFFQDGSRLGLEIDYSLEQTPLGTAGAIAANVHKLDEDVLVLNGDVLTTLNYKRLFSFHQRERAAATISIYPREVKVDFGVVEVAEKRLLRYTEKPVYRHHVSMGINVVNIPRVRSFLKAGEHLDLPQLMTSLHEGGESVLCYEEPCAWLDIGRLEDYQAANEMFESRREEFLP